MASGIVAQSSKHFARCRCEPMRLLKSRDEISLRESKRTNSGNGFS